MSRRHDFPSRGSGEVEMSCGWCGREEWVPVVFDSASITSPYAELEDWCLAQLASEQSDWRYTHDAYVCSEQCASKWWDQ